MTMELPIGTGARLLAQDAVRRAREDLHPDPTDRREVAEAARQFEALLATQLVRELRRSVPGGLFEGAGSDTYHGLFDRHLGEMLAESEALGVAAMLRATLAPHSAKGDSTP